MTIKDLGTIGGLMSVVVAVVGGGWAVAEKLHQGSEAYAQVRDLRDDVHDIEKRLNNSVDRQWKMFKMQQARPGEESDVDSLDVLDEEEEPAAEPLPPASAEDPEPAWIGEE